MERFTSMVFFLGTENEDASRMPRVPSTLLLERAMGFEPTTLGLGSRCSTTALQPLSYAAFSQVNLCFHIRQAHVRSPHKWLWCTDRGTKDLGMVREDRCWAESKTARVLTRAVVMARGSISRA